MKEDDVVGFVDESRLLKTWLMDKEEHRTLISMVGMGGSGKTTLVAKTYNDETVKSYFECCAWITVSQTYTRDDLLRSLIKEFHQSRKEVPNDLGTKDFKDLVGILIGYLEQKKYLVVLDDVWDTNLWEAIKVSLPNNQFGSRIMLTTRKEDVGSYSSDVRKKEKFGVVYDGKVEIGECESHQARRLSIQTTKGHLQSYGSMTQLRSLFVFVNGSVSFSDKFLSKFKLLRALDLENSAIDILPDVVGTLFNLRYFNLRGTPVAELPKSVGKLRNLEMLNIRNTNIKELPSEAVELQNLRLLKMSSEWIGDIHNFEFATGVKVPFEISKLKKLQAVAYIKAEGEIVRQLGNMTQLNRMGILNLKEADEQNMCSSIQNLKLLNYLCLMVNNEAEILRVKALKTPPPTSEASFV
ncbi:hypothetical protein GH714_014614 [Hevea brasiliensis]|uniref:Uncharacterized protein n=1 Tax=Hevea brasiliensis TaxID=3981 RepID=A0A6A6LAE2_HEVBR|nr:hypothetical protein GH714_014614 [Hevea brasiliensis]